MATRLFRHQADAVRRAAAPGTRGLLLCFGVGAGKTLTSIRAAEALMARDRRLTVVVAVPAALAINFGNELAKAGADASRFTVLTFHGFTAAYRQNPDGLRGRVLIFDEAHNLRNTSTALSKAAVGAAPSAHSVILLTGTPLQNRPADISPLLNMIRPGCLPLPQKGFEDRFGEDGLSSNLAEIRRAVAGAVAHYAVPQTAAGYPTIGHRDVEVTLYPEQAEAHRNAVRGLPVQDFDDLANFKQLLAFLTGPRRIANCVKMQGRVYGAKLDVIAASVEAACRAGQKSIVYSSFIEYGTDALRAKLAARRVPCAVISGAQSATAKERARLDYNSRKVLVLVFSRAGAEGMSLTDTAHVHICEPAWNDANVEQVIGRSRRLGSHSGRYGNHVAVRRYVAVLPAARSVLSQVRRLARHVRLTNPLAAKTADEVLRDMSERKDAINNRFFAYCLQHGQ